MPRVATDIPIASSASVRSDWLGVTWTDSWVRECLPVWFAMIFTPTGEAALWVAIWVRMTSDGVLTDMAGPSCPAG